MRLLVVVPARGGSKGLPGKNLLPVGGVSLVGRAVRTGLSAVATLAARSPDFAGKVVVDTDDRAIADEGLAWGAEVPFLRDAALAGDGVAMFDNVDACLRRWAERGFEADTVLLLQPTSPLRSLADVLACVAAYEESGGSAEAIVACEHPAEQTLRRNEAGTLTVAFPSEDATRRRQDYLPSYRSSGSAYVNAVTSLRATRSFLVPGETKGVVVHRDRAVDIDDLSDLLLARHLHAQRPIAAPPWRTDSLAAFTPDDTRLHALGALSLHGGQSLRAILDELVRSPKAFAVAPDLAAFSLLRDAIDVPVILSSASLAEHAAALSHGALGFVAPASLHPRVLEVAPSVRPRPAVADRAAGLPLCPGHPRCLPSNRAPSLLPCRPAPAARWRLASSPASTSRPPTW